MLYIVYFLHEGRITDAYEALSTEPPECSWALPIEIAGTGTKLSAWQWIAWGCVPVSIFKNVVNVIQLLSASSDLGGADMADRAKARRNKAGRSPSPSRKKKGRNK